MPEDVKKNKSLGAFGNTKSISDRYKFGTPEEIAERVATNYPSPPHQHPTNFEQIKPGPTGTDINSHTPTGRSGNQKYGEPRRYA